MPANLGRMVRRRTKQILHSQVLLHYSKPPREPWDSLTPKESFDSNTPPLQTDELEKNAIFLAARCSFKA
jgi:hypothetical protein